MRKVILGVAVSLDSFIEGPRGEYDWCFTDRDYGMKAFLKTIDALFMGRKTYEMAAAQGQTNPWKGITSYVFSRTLKSAKGATLVSGDLLKETTAIRKAKGKDIWLFGGAELTASMMNHGLVDELWLAVHPILLGGGKPLFQNIHDRVKLKLNESDTYETGLVSLKYTVVYS